MGDIGSYNTDESRIKEVVQNRHPDWGVSSIKRIKITSRSAVYEVVCINAAPRIISLLPNTSQEDATKELSSYIAIYDELMKKEVPVPNILDVSKNSQDLGFPYYIMTKLEGEQADTLLQGKIRRADVNEIVEALANVLYRI